MCRSTSPTCAARTVRPKPTPELADSACRPTSRTVPRRTLGQINDQCRARRAADRRSRARRWYDAVAELVILQSEYAQWFEALPENLQEGATGKALQAIVDLDLDELDRRRAIAPLRARLRRRYRCCLIRCAAYAQITSVQRAPRHGRHQSECPARRHRSTHIGLAQLGEAAPAALSGPLGARLGAVTSANLAPIQK